MKKLVLVFTIVQLFAACKNEKHIDESKVKKNIEQYVKVHVSDCTNIDSLKFYVLAVTERGKMIRQFFSFDGAATSWREYKNDKYKFYDYSDDYCDRMANRYDSIAKKIENKHLSADSTKVVFWQVRFGGIYTSTDLTLKMFEHEFYMNANYNFIENKDFYDLPTYPYGRYGSTELKSENFDKRKWDIFNLREVEDFYPTGPDTSVVK